MTSWSSASSQGTPPTPPSDLCLTVSTTPRPESTPGSSSPTSKRGFLLKQPLINASKTTIFGSMTFSLTNMRVAHFAPLLCFYTETIRKVLAFFGFWVFVGFVFGFDWYAICLRKCLGYQGRKKLTTMVIPSIFLPEDWSFTFYEGLNRHPDSIFRDRTVAELGCGNGWISIAIAEKWLPSKVSCWFFFRFCFCFWCSLHDLTVRLSSGLWAWYQSQSGQDFLAKLVLECFWWKGSTCLWWGE